MRKGQLLFRGRLLSSGFTIFLALSTSGRVSADDHVNKPDEPCHRDLRMLEEQQTVIQKMRKRNRTLAQLSELLTKPAEGGPGEINLQLFRVLGVEARFASWERFEPQLSFEKWRRRAFRDLITWLVHNSKGVFRWTDFGGGDGTAVGQIADGLDIPGVPIVATVVDVIKKEAVSGSMDVSGANELRFVWADATEYRSGEPQDLITSFWSFAYMKDKLGALIHWYNDLKVGGSLIVVGDESGKVENFLSYQGEGTVWERSALRDFFFKARGIGADIYVLRDYLGYPTISFWIRKNQKEKLRWEPRLVDAQESLYGTLKSLYLP